MVKNGDLRFLLLELILADQLADLPPVNASSSQEWWLEISTVRVNIGRSTGRSIPLVEASDDQEWWFEITTVRAHIGHQLADLPLQ